MKEESRLQNQEVVPDSLTWKGLAEKSKQCKEKGGEGSKLGLQIRLDVVLKFCDSNKWTL